MKNSTVLLLCLVPMACSSSPPQAPDAGAPDSGIPSGSCPSTLQAAGPACVPRFDTCGSRQLPKPGGGCQAVGVEECAGGLKAPDGVCRQVGPGQSCLAGWVAKESWCEPRLPGTACTGGTTEVLGQEACQPIGACGSGPWGAIATGPQTLFVDAGYGGGASDGSAARPFTRISDALLAAPVGGQVAVAAGDYGEDLALSKGLTLEGRCASMVRITGAGSNPRSAVEVGGGAAVTLRGLTISGAKEGLSVTQGTLTLERSAVVGCGDAGVVAVGSTLTIKDSRLAGNHHFGLLGEDSEVTLERVTIRDTAPLLPANTFGTGIQIERKTRPTRLTARDCLLAANRHLGVAARGAEVSLERTVIKDTLPQLKDHLYGYGLVGYRLGSEPSVLSLKDCIIASNTAGGLVLYGSSATLERTVLRDTQPQEAGKTLGVGARLLSYGGAGSGLVLRESALVRNRTSAIALSGSGVELERSLIRETLPQASDQVLGLAISGLPDGTLAPAVVVRDSIIEKSQHGALYLKEGAHLLERSLITATEAAADDAFGIGVTLTAEQPAASVTLKQSRVTGSRLAGLMLVGGSGTLEESVVDGTREQLSDGKFGLGIYAEPRGSAQPKLVMRRSLVSGNRSSGVFLVGVTAELDGVSISGTQAEAAGGQRGMGLVVERGAGTTTLQVSDSLIVANRAVGVGLWGVEATLLRTEVRDTAPQQVDEAVGVGLLAASVDGAGSLTLADSAVLGSHGVGVQVEVAKARVQRCRIAGTRPAADPFGFGDGLSVEPRGPQAELIVEDSLIEENARVGLLYVKASGRVVRSVFRGNLLPIDLENGATPEIADDNLLQGNTDDRIGNDSSYQPSAAPQKPPPPTAP